jgi:Rrf2 family iron-sulfur cluster assembly transcriptional regulator
MFSKTTEYALRATIYIAQKGTRDDKLGIDEIAKAIDSPKPFTAKILQMLTRDKIVSSTRGPNGGFYFTAQAKKLPAIAILKAVNDEGVLKRCILGLRECSQKNPCPMHAEYKEIRGQLNNLFEKKTIGSLVEKMNNQRFFIGNSVK